MTTIRPSTAPDHAFMVCAELPPRVVGGLGRYAERFVGALSARGTDVDVYGPGDECSPSSHRLGRVTVHRLPMPFDPRVASGPGRGPVAGRILSLVGLLVFTTRTTVRILRAGALHRGSIVAVHDWMGAPTAIACRVLARRRTVFHVHTNELTSGTTWRNRSVLATGIAALEGVMARLADRIVVPTAKIRDDVIDRGWPAEKVRVVPHGVEDPELSRLTCLSTSDTQVLRDRVRARYLRSRGPLIVFAGRFSPHKGISTLLRSLPTVLAAHPGARVLLIGTESPGTTENLDVARTIDRLGLGPAVVSFERFLGSAELFEHLVAADVCVFPSTYEPFGLVAVEAMALSRPVVLGPGYAAEVAGTDAALQCTRDCPDQLADLLLRCLDEPQDAARRAARGAAHVRRAFSWDRTADATLRVWAEAAR